MYSEPPRARSATLSQQMERLAPWLVYCVEKTTTTETGLFLYRPLLFTLTLNTFLKLIHITLN